MIDVVVCTVKKEARAIKVSATDYELAQFTYAHTLAHTSSTLLTLVSELVSDGKVSKNSISLSQAMPTHITGARNQTTLELAVKLHHRHGSSELIKDLHQHGFVVSYDEVLRFRKSAANFVMEKAEILHRVMGLETRVGIVCGWFDNLDLQVSTPNGRRDTHAMAHQFQLSHPAGIIETGTARPGISSFIVPRIKKQESARQQTNVDKTAIKLYCIILVRSKWIHLHCQCNQLPIPMCVPCKLPYTLLKKRICSG